MSGQISQDLNLAVEILRAGGVVAVPTETVYGLAADASNPEAVKRIFEIKCRPASNPLIVHVAELNALENWATTIPQIATQLAARFSPGPLTYILPKKSHVEEMITAGKSTIGLRIPQHPLTLELLQMFGGGLAAPSANRFTRVSPTSAIDVQSDLGDQVDLILDGGRCEIGIESTILDLTQSPPVVLRHGAVSQEEIEQVIGPVSTFNRAATASPGQSKLHYSTQTPMVRVEGESLSVFLRNENLKPKKIAVLTQEPAPKRLDNPNVTWLQLPGDERELAREIYKRFRDCDCGDYDLIVVTPAAESGIGRAINDRIHRASRDSI
ncbi:MAG: L-threonylcarbamoyladenylate synthase [Pirellulaceae bacterium]